MLLVAPITIAFHLPVLLRKSIKTRSHLPLGIETEDIEQIPVNYLMNVCERWPMEFEIDWKVASGSNE